MVKLGPDCASGKEDAYSGYLSHGNITGFSMMHESGTGGAPKYGVVSQMPVAGSVSNPLADISVTRAADDVATVGYYQSQLVNGVIAELTASAHAGLYRYTFQEPSSVVVDVSHVLPSFRGLGWGQTYTSGQITVGSDGSYQGSGTYKGGWNLAPDWTIYFCGKFDQPPISTKTFSGNDITLEYYGTKKTASGTDRVGAVFAFKKGKVRSRVGISFISTEKACQNLHSEVPAGITLQMLVNQAKTNWNEQIFSKIIVTGGTTTEQRQLYTNLYGMHLIPSNRTGENPLWDSDEPYYDDIFTFWDTFRCTTALQHILQPEAYEEQIRSLFDVQKNEGFMPDARSSNRNGKTQGGSNADNVLADAYVKGVRGAVDWEDGFAAMKADAENVPPNNHDPIAPDSSTKEGRGALSDWTKYGWITPTFSRAVSRAVEYSANDFALYQVAHGLGKTKQAQKYLQRSRNWRNHWNPDAESLGFKGFVVPRKADGTFVEQDPLSCGGCYWQDAYYEGLPWEYSMNAHHDIGTLISLSGGRGSFTQRLEKMFEPGVVDNDAINGTIFNPANEPSFTTPYLFNFVGRQDRSVEYARFNAKQYYRGVEPNGLPGNSDAGAMQSWLLWNMIGLYPVTGQTTFLVGSPWFPSMTMQLGGGRQLQITANGGSEGGYYVQSLKVNGQPWNKAWVSWDDVFASGGTIEFELGAEPVMWATGAPPPSPATEMMVRRSFLPTWLSL